MAEADDGLIKSLLQRMSSLEERTSRLERALLEFLPRTSQSRLDAEFWRIHDLTKDMDRRSGESRRLWKEYWAKKQLAREIEGTKPEVRTPKSIRWTIESRERSMNALRRRLEKGIVWNGKDKGKPLSKEQLEGYELRIQAYEDEIKDLKKELAFLTGKQ